MAMPAQYAAIKAQPDGSGARKTPGTWDGRRSPVPLASNQTNIPPYQGVTVHTLHIEHAVTDFATWNTAFGTFADQRQRSGVRHQRVQRPVNDPAYVVIDLDFDTASQAANFLGFLQANVWRSPGSAPALIGTPQTRILELTQPSSRDAAAPTAT
jgi:hypothetical protein